MIIKIRNLLDELAQSTNLTQTEAIGVGTVHVKNANGFSAQWAVQIGNTGEERSEIAVLTSATPSGTSLVFSGTTTFSHPTDTPVFATKYDQFILKRSTSGTSGTASAYATVNITPDNIYTQYDDTSGLTTYAYKAAYYNSSLALTSSDSDWITPTGYDYYSLAKIRSRIKNKLMNAGFIGNDDVIDDWINEYLEMMTNAVIDVDRDYAIGTTNVSFSGTAEQGTITATDFKQIKRAWWTSDGATSYEMKPMSVSSYEPQQVFSEQYPFFYQQGDSILGRKPSTASGTASLLYYKLNPVLVNDGDLLPVPMRGYTNGFVNYALAQAYYKDSKDRLGDRKLNESKETLSKFVNEATPRAKSGPQYIEQVEPVDNNIDPFL